MKPKVKGGFAVLAGVCQIVKELWAKMTVDLERLYTCKWRATVEAGGWWVKSAAIRD
jgi:hypothetical protein